MGSGRNVFGELCSNGLCFSSFFRALLNCIVHSNALFWAVVKQSPHVTFHTRMPPKASSSVPWLMGMGLERIGRCSLFGLHACWSLFDVMVEKACSPEERSACPLITITHTSPRVDKHLGKGVGAISNWHITEASSFVV